MGVPPSSTGYVEYEPSSAPEVTVSPKFEEPTAPVHSTLVELPPRKGLLRRSPWVWLALIIVAVLIIVGVVVGAVLGTRSKNSRAKPTTLSQTSSATSSLSSAPGSSPTESPKSYTILSANYAGRNITEDARSDIQKGPNLVVNMAPVTEPWAFPGGDDPWVNVNKCLSLLHSYGDSIRTFVTCEGKGNFTITPGEPNPPGLTHEIMRQGPSTASFAIASVVWGAEEVTDREVYKALYAYRSNGSTVPFTNEFFRVDTHLGTSKSGVIWWTEDNFVSFKGIYGREGDESITLLAGM